MAQVCARKSPRSTRSPTPLLASINDRGVWLQILDDLNARLPKENIWITELAPTLRRHGHRRNRERPAGVAASRARRRPRAAAEPRPARRRGPAIDGVFVRGLYLSNPKQQEIVVDYFRNLLDSTIFEVDREQPIASDQAEHADEHGMGLSLRAAAETARAACSAMNWFRQNQFLGGFLVALRDRDAPLRLFSAARKGARR